MGLIVTTYLLTYAITFIIIISIEQGRGKAEQINVYLLK